MVGFASTGGVKPIVNVRCRFAAPVVATAPAAMAAIAAVATSHSTLRLCIIVLLPRGRATVPCAMLRAKRRMRTPAAIVGAAEARYTRHPAPGTTTESFLADAFVAALRSAGLRRGDVDGPGVSSFTLPPDHAI